MVRLLAGSLLALGVLATAASADDKKEDKEKPTFTGAWTREAGGIDITFEFVKGKKDVLKVLAMAGDNGAVVTCKYEAKGDKVTLKITEVEEKGSFPAKPPVGLELKFKWTVKGDTATLDELEGHEEAKPVLEGEYTKKKAKD